MHFVAYITDNGYLLPTKVSIASLVQNAGGEDITIYVVTLGVPDQQQRELVALGKETVTVRVKPLTELFTPPEFRHVYLTTAAFAKIQLPELFPELNELLYLDGDTLLSPGCTNIFSTDVSTVYAAVVMDMCAMVQGEWHRKLGLERYFNAGVMYLNLAKMREDGLPAQLCACCARPDYEFLFGEQNALNSVFGGRVTYLNPAYNFLSLAYTQRFSLEEIARFFDVSEGDLRAPFIRHFAGSRKPWRLPDTGESAAWARFVSCEDHLTVVQDYCKTLAEEQKRASRELTRRLDSSARFQADVAYLSILAPGKATTPYRLGCDLVAGKTDGVHLEGFFREESWGRWATACCTIQILLEPALKPVADFRIAFRVCAFHSPRIVRITFNGSLLREITALPTRRDFTITVAASTLRPVNRLAFSSDAPAVSPAELQVGADRRKLGIGFSYLYLDEDTRALSRRLLANHSTFEGQVAALQGANAQLEERVAQLEGRMAIMENEVLHLRGSFSLKVGRAVTFLPRAIFRLLKRCRSLGRPPS